MGSPACKVQHVVDALNAKMSGDDRPVTSAQLAQALRDGTVRHMPFVAREKARQLFARATPSEIGEACAEIGARMKSVCRLYTEVVRSGAPRSSAWEAFAEALAPTPAPVAARPVEESPLAA